ncbi:putative MFS family arabinose efflux permease [Isoptericola sp. CG 20/1183]|uniref:MFS family arabinose efflux permease n=1 Tax=Isoptericola halotolerans TaxID=300560 RepID=A0ABX5ECY9_9MICO|nr:MULTISPECIES: MFS transporter [Isoptericola]PRZ05696.1 putative MFS family arabinose efflux permease [Isoptericola halotolerans]PRZ06264.1 putative MFS family arabinose efflux permease [Isoptericola sp. CG 20/1183]
MADDTDTAPGGPPDAATAADPQQRRTVLVLVLAQVLSGAGLAAGVTVGALLAAEMLATTAYAGLPAALFTAGSAAAALVVGRLSQRWGRRAGLTFGYLTGAVGAAGVVVAAVLDDVVLLFVAFAVYGAGTATNLQARYAGADLAAPRHRGRAVSTVLVATTVGAVAGPNLVGVMGDLAAGWGIPPLAGPFLLGGAAYAAAGVVLWVLLRPDPLLLARERAEQAEPRPEAAPARTSVSSTAQTAAPATSATTLAPPPQVAEPTDRQVSRTVLLAGTIMVLTQGVMVAIMTMTPIHMEQHGHAVATAGFVIAVHVGMMYLPSPLSGWLTDRFGPVRVAVAAAATLLAAGLVSALVPPSSVAGLAVGLGLLGLGWSLGLVSGTALLTTSVPLATRARTQGSVDLAVALAGAAGGLGSGFVVASSSYAALALGGGALALLVLPVIAFAARAPARRTSRSAPE